ncbi:MAG TPA: PTS sugar transporter subunit IIA [Candidatus Cloacimonadota bacterium]|nr:PTS sugar transporter subunit IIA [Candidatus Cloacimonadota bacterium]
MLLSSYLDADTIAFETSLKSTAEIYADQIGRINRHHKLPLPSPQIVDLVLARDAVSSTAYPSGLAIPHIRLDNFNDTVIAMTFLQNPADYNGTPARLVVLIITDKSSSKLYLNLVATLLKLSANPDIMSQLQQARDGGAVLGLLRKHNICVKTELTCSDIMDSDPITIRPEAKLRDLGNLMNERHVAGMPVVKSDGSYMGEVDVLNLLKVGIPDYMLMMDHLGFLGSFEPLEQLFVQEDIKTVGEIMVNDGITLDPSASIIEAVFEMIQHKKRFISVVRDHKLLGVITAMEVFRKVFKS